MFPKLILLISLIISISSYNRQKAVDYAEKWWNKANHDCKSDHDACTPYSYWGSESCGFKSHGGDCANFVSQCLLAGGHPKLTKGECRGYPCGVEEVGATKLAHCLKDSYGWKSTCGHREAPPKNIKKGDVIVYFEGSKCTGNSHAAIVVSGGKSPTIACHSSNHYGISYDYQKNDKSYYNWLHYNDDK